MNEEATDQIPWHLQSADNLTEYFNEMEMPIDFKWANDGNGKRCLEAWDRSSRHDDTQTSMFAGEIEEQPILTARFYSDGHPEYGDYRVLLTARCAFCLDGYILYIALERLLEHDPQQARAMALMHMDAFWMCCREVVCTKFGIIETRDGYALDDRWTPPKAA